jgi:hypothetical protein
MQLGTIAADAVTTVDAIGSDHCRVQWITLWKRIKAASALVMTTRPVKRKIGCKSW